jgi:NAD(P)-dependent dehydrogenase (short-subunit alcohol dehydrogenase family)
MTTWLITGCSTGFGRSLAKAALRRGHRVAVTARDVERVKDLQDLYPTTALALALDVTDDASVQAAVGRVHDHFGTIDVLVNNAGYAYTGAVEEGEQEPVEAMFDTNFFGVLRMVQAVLPRMREQRSGRIVNVSSIGTRITIPGGGFYSATKAAVEALSGSLRKEISELGIDVVVVAPGVMETDFNSRSAKHSQRQIHDYDTVLHRDSDSPRPRHASDPDDAAAVFVDVVSSPDAPALLLLGADAYGGFIDATTAEQEDVRQNEAKTRSVAPRS